MHEHKDKSNIKTEAQQSQIIKKDKQKITNQQHYNVLTL